MSHDNLTSVGKRIIGNTPPFWKKVRNISAGLMVVAGAIVAAPESLELPEMLVKYANYAIFALGTLATAAQATTHPPKEDPEL